MHALSLEQLTVLPALPPELIDIAAATGCPIVYVSLKSIHGLGPAYDFTAQPELLAETRRRAENLGVTIRTAGSVMLHADLQFDTARRILDCVAELGAQDVLATGYDPDAGRCGDNFARVCEEALQRDLGVLLEPVSYSEVRTLAQGEDLLRRRGNQRSGLVVDILQLYRSGDSVADIGKVEPRYLRYAQICDGPRDMAPENHVKEARLQRMIPGEGLLPVKDFLRELPPDIPLGIEVPLADRAAQGMSPMERARLCVEATRRIQQAL